MKRILPVVASLILGIGVFYFQKKPTAAVVTESDEVKVETLVTALPVPKESGRKVEPIRRVQSALPPSPAKSAVEPRSLPSIFASMKSANSDYGRALKNFLADARQADTPEALVARANELMEMRKRLAEIPDEAARVAAEFLEKTKDDSQFASERTMTMGLAGDLPRGSRPVLAAEISADIRSTLKRGAWDSAYFENAVRAYLKNTADDPARSRSRLEAEVSNLPDSPNRRRFFEAYDELSKDFP
jgi:hypothetical protein